MELSRRFADKKFMWDGRNYPGEKQAQEAAQKYRAEGFEVELVAEDGCFYVFSRREVREVVVEGKPL